MPLLQLPPRDHVELPSSYQISDRDFNAIRNLIYRHAGISLSGSKRALVCARLAKRLRDLGLHTHGEYLDHLAARDPDGKERQEMINCLTTNKTDFFREPHHFAFLRDVVFPKLDQQTARGGPRRLRIWSAGCSMGDEPYSIAMQVLEHSGFQRGWDLRILASDISTRVLETAQQGVYPREHLAPVPEELQRRYFLLGTGESQGFCQVRPEVRRLITFRRINFMDRMWPVRARFDVIFCRNVIIYFDLPTQQRLLRRLAALLTDDGYLILGHSENPHWLTDVVRPLGKTIYQRDGRSAPGEPIGIGETISGGLSQSGHHASHGRDEKATVPLRSATAISSPAPSRRLALRKALGRPAVVKASRLPALQGASIRHREIVAGEVFAARGPAEVSTLLGSCVAACLFDPETRIGGMNHFMLPCQGVDQSASARYGCNAMELLINGIMKLGGDRRRLQAKVFGGANMLNFSDASRNVGDLNVAFVRRFLQTDGIPILAERLGGDCALRVHFLVATGKAYVKTYVKSENLLDRETRYAASAAQRLVTPPDDNVTLF